MSVIDEAKAREEVTVFLRNIDILTINERGVTTVTETFDGSGAEQTITLSNNVVRNIRSVNDGSAKKVYADYTPSYSASSTTITGTFENGTDNVSVVYDYSSGATEKVWGDFPDLVNVKVSDFPRVGFDFVSSSSTLLGIGDSNYMSSKLGTFRVYDNSISVIERALSTLRQAVKDSQKDFYYFGFVKLSNIGPIIVHENLNKKIRERSLDLEFMFGFES